ncbi:hypothetical protein [Streptomyces sp. CB00316]|uniref:hypothetical protein n=1 Tax=Streptomyces sp. CB00316 TaxID=1703932 RepID=UPI001160EDD4|nr:hypothetical protein [Streptomyces sp. CB00316]
MDRNLTGRGPLGRTGLGFRPRHPRPRYGQLPRRQHRSPGGVLYPITDIEASVRTALETVRGLG